MEMILHQTVANHTYTHFPSVMIKGLFPNSLECNWSRSVREIQKNLKMLIVTLVEENRFFLNRTIKDVIILTRRKFKSPVHAGLA